MKISLSGNFQHLHFPPATRLSAGEKHAWVTLLCAHTIIAGLKTKVIGLFALLLLEPLYLYLFSFSISVDRGILFFRDKNKFFIIGLRKALLKLW